MEPWSRYPLHLFVAVLATVGAASALDGPNSTLGALFWCACLAGALLNAACFGVGWERRRSAGRVVREDVASA